MMKECWSSRESPWFLWTWPGETRYQLVGVCQGVGGYLVGFFTGEDCNDPLVSAHLTRLMRGVLGAPHSPGTDVAVLRCSTVSTDQ